MKLLIPFFLIVLMSCGVQSEKKELALPSLDLLLPDSATRFNTANIETGRPVALLYFSPDCEHCQEETEGIIKNIDSLKNLTIYMITNDPFERLQAFNAHYKIYKYPNIIVGRDEQFVFIRHFKNVTPPYMILYDRLKKQKEIFDGATDISQIIKSVNSL